MNSSENHSATLDTTGGIDVHQDSDSIDLYNNCNLNINISDDTASTSSFPGTENNNGQNSPDNADEEVFGCILPPDINTAFETKVIQISENLKDTTLAETDGSLPNFTPATPSQQDISSDNGITLEDGDGRSKKVRFHPDVKSNDGGNRVIPKKKKKQRNNTSPVDELELHSLDDSDFEEEESFDAAKTIAQAKDYLVIHPLSFLCAKDKGTGTMKNGLLEESDLVHITESSDEEDLHDQTHPENGVERILGKQMKCQKVEFLLRYAGQFNLLWEPEHVVRQQCPNLLKTYERCREYQQENLMRHVAKRQNLRQRYTDF